MDKLEVLEATLHGEKTDRIPCGFWHHFSQEKSIGEASIQAHLDFFNAIDADILKIMNEHMYHVPTSISKPSDWAKLQVQNLFETPYEAYIKEIKEIKKRLPNDVPVVATIHGVLVSAYHATELPGHFSNPQNMVSRHLREDPELVAKGLQSIADTLILLCEQLANVGVDGIYYAALGGEEYRFTPEFFTSYVKPFDKLVIDAINSLDVMSILHICKDKVMLPLYEGLDANVVNWAIHDCQYGLSEGRKLFPKATLLGGFDDRAGVLVDGSRTQIENEIDTIIQTAGRNRLIIGADCTLPPDVAIWRLRAAKNHAHLN
jgi:uroporphyrinogen decarboxylase